VRPSLELRAPRRKHIFRLSACSYSGILMRIGEKIQNVEIGPGFLSASISPRTLCLVSRATGQMKPRWQRFRKLPKTPPRMTRLLTPRSLTMMWLRFLSSSRRGSCKCFDKSGDITCVVVRGERDPNASATYTAHNIMTTKTFYNCLYAFARVSQ
jgi:hypothetical protein